MSRIPLISIVTATYNRSRSLALTLRAIQRQTYDNWELIVVGDACTDDTAATVAALADDRIRFHNLVNNVGEQAGPNNFGWTVSRGDYVAFCNHDVIWLPHHLTAAWETLATERSDLVFGTTAILGGDAPVPLRWSDLRVALDGIPARSTWDPGLLNAATVSASAMVMRRSLLERVNGWRLGRDCPSEPSQDLLYRAWRAGARINSIGMVTGVTAPSGMRPGSYVGNVAPESEWLVEQLDRSDLAAELLAAATETNDVYDARHSPRPRHIVQRGARLLARLGVDPRRLWFRFARRYGRGQYIAALRRTRGLDNRPGDLGEAAALRYGEVDRVCQIELGKRVLFAAGAGGARHLAAGWSRPDAEGVWADGPSAELRFQLPADPGSDLVLELQLRVFGGPRTTARQVGFAVQNRGLGTLRIPADSGWVTHRVGVLRSDVVNRRLSVRLLYANPESPASLGLSDDARQLSVGLVALTLSADATTPI